MARYAKSITMAVDDTKPDFVQYVIDEETGNAVDLTAADSVTMFLYNMKLATYKIEDVASTITQVSPGILTYTWATDGTDTDVAGRYRGWHVIYWAGSSAEPMTASYVNITILNPWEKVG